MMLFGLEFPVLLAPMAGVTDTSFRLACQRYGADMAYTEMVSAKGLFYNGKNTYKLLELDASEGMRGVQLFGREPDIIERMADALAENAEKSSGRIACIDINMGCPAKKIVNCGEGSALMKEPLQAARVVSAAVKGAGGRVPVTVKLRAGWDADHINAVEIAKICEDEGAYAVTVHGRTREQFYSGSSDRDIIRRVKEAVSIPVIGNGDIFTGADAVAMKLYTGCDGIMAARGAEGNPFIFDDIKHALAGESYTPPTPMERIAECIRQMDDLVARNGNGAVIEMRKHAAWYTKGMKGASAIRGAINGAKTPQDMRELLLSLFD